MPINVTKILFRRGKDSERRTIVFDQGEPAYTSDTERLFIGDGITLGGVPLSIQNYGFVNQLSGNYLNTNLSLTAFQLLSGSQIGDIVYDQATTNIWAVTSSTYGYPMLSDFAPFAITPYINSAQFVFTNGTQLNLKDSGITYSKLNPNTFTYPICGGYNAGSVGIRAKTIGNNLLAPLLNNSVKANTSNTSDGPTDLQLTAQNQVVGRGTGSLGAITLSGAGAIKLTPTTDTIVLSSIEPLPITGGTMQGELNATTYRVVVSANPTRGKDYAVGEKWVLDLPCYGTFAQTLAYFDAIYLPLSGGTMTGAITGYNNNSNDLYIDQTRLTVTPPGQIRRQGPTGWGKGVTTFDIYSDGGTIGVGDAGSLSAYMNRNGNGYFRNNLGVGKSVDVNNPLADIWINTANNGNIHLGNNDASGYTLQKNATSSGFFITRGTYNAALTSAIFHTISGTDGLGNTNDSIAFNGLATNDSNLDIYSGHLGQTAGNYLQVNRKIAYAENWCALREYFYRRANGGDWSTVDYRLQYRVDATDFGSIIYNPQSASGTNNGYGAIAFATGGTGGGYTEGVYERMRIDRYGKIGIGTTGPNQKLALSGSSSNALIRTFAGGVAGTRGYDIGVKYGNTTSYPYFGYGIWDTNGVDDSTTASTNVFYIDWNTKGTYLVPNGGNVGIGTTDPNFKLDVRGDVNIGDPNIANNAGDGNKLLFNGGNNTDQISIFRNNVSNNVSELRVQVGDDSGWYSGGSDYFVVGNYPSATPGVWSDWLRIGSNVANFAGKLGVNTSTTANPGATLTVNGTISAKGEITAQNGYGRTIYMGGDAAGNDLEIGSTTSGQNKIVFYNRTDNKTMQIVSDSVLANGLTAIGNIHFVNSNLSIGYVPAGLYADGANIALRAPKTVGGSGGVFMQSYNGANTFGLFTSAGLDMSNKNIYSVNSISTGLYNTNTTTSAPGYYIYDRTARTDYSAIYRVNGFTCFWTSTYGDAFNYDTSGSVNFNKNINVSQQIVIQGKNKPSNWGGGVTTFDVFADGGSVGAGNGSTNTINAYFNAAGYGSVAKDFNVGGTLSVSGVNVGGTITAGKFSGDGSLLTSLNVNREKVFKKFKDDPNCCGTGQYDRANTFLSNDNRLYICGYNGYGLGLGPNANYSDGFKQTMIPLAAGEYVTNWYTAFNSMYALTNLGRLWSTGYNGYGQLGRGDTTDRNGWDLVLNLSNVTYFSCRNGESIYTSCLAISNGNLYAWGYNGYGQLGSGLTTNITTPTLITGGAIAGKILTKAFACGDDGSGYAYSHSFVIDNNRNVYACGYNNYGWLGLGNTTQYLTFQQVPNMKADLIKSKTLYGNGTSFLLDGNTLYSCGYNGNGQFGKGTATGDNGTPSNQYSYTFKNYTGLSVKSFYTFEDYNSSVIALLTDNTVRTWGYNNNGQLGNGLTTPIYSPFNPGLTNIIKVMGVGAGTHYGISYALDASGNLWGAGYNAYGQLGYPWSTNNQYSFTKVWKDANIVFVDFHVWGAANQYTGFTAADSNGFLWSCGYNGQNSTGVLYGSNSLGSMAIPNKVTIH